MPKYKIFQTGKYKIFRFTWKGQINFTSEGLKYLLNKSYKKYIQDFKIEEIKTEEINDEYAR